VVEKDMGTKKGQQRKTARRAYESKRMKRAKIATNNMPLEGLIAEVRRYFRK